MVDEVLGRLVKVSYRLVVEPPNHLKDVITDVRKRWKDDLCGEAAADEVDAYGDAREIPSEFDTLENHRQKMVESSVDPLLVKVRDSIWKELSEAEKWAFELGKRVDEGMRRSDVHRFFDGWVDVPVDPPPEGPYSSVKGLSERRLIWRSPQPGELEADDTWPDELQDLLTKTGISDAGAEILTAWKKEDPQDRINSMPRLLEHLDRSVREHLSAFDNETAGTKTQETSTVTRVPPEEICGELPL